MTPAQSPDDRARYLRRRLHELDDTLRARRQDLQQLRDAIHAMQTERRTVAEELAAFRAALARDVSARLEEGMTVRQIASALNQPPAAISRVIEQIRAASRKKGRGS